jgi:PAS domain-containing protein
VNDIAYELEYRLRIRNGEIRWVWDRGRALSSSDIKPVVLEGFAVDITERLKAVKSLQESKEKYKTITETPPRVVYQSCRGTGVFCSPVSLSWN